MKKLLAIGEALVDIFNNDEVKVGGAPLNVLGANSKLGGHSFFIGKISSDEYGELIINTMKTYNIHSDYITLSNDPTAKAYVKTLENGDREFSFDRHNSADQMLNKNEIKEEWFKNTFALHFCSVCLDEFPCKYAHIKAIDLARKNGCIVSFDLNVRLALAEDHELLKKTILEFIPKADIIKLSIEELEFLDKTKSIQNLFIGEVKCVLLTLGEKGSVCYLKDGTFIESKGYKCDVIDTTGAGDGFIGSFLYQLVNSNKNILDLSHEEIQKYMDFSNRFCSLSVTKKGAIDSYPTKEEMKRVI